RSFPYGAGRSGFSRTALLYKLCVELNVLDCRQRLRYRTALLRCLGLLLELGVVDAWDFAFGIELDAGDTESALYRLDVDLRRRADALRGEAGASQPGGEGHREAPGMCRGDQLFGVAALALLESGRERVRALVGAAAKLHRSLTFAK